MITRKGRNWWEPLAGFGFVVLYFVGVAVLSNSPDESASDSKWTSYFANSGHQAELVVSGFVLVLAALCLASFITGLWNKARLSGPGDLSRTLSLLPIVAAAISAACIAASGVLKAAVSGGMIFGDLPEPSAGLLRFADNYWFPMAALGGMLAAALAVAIVSRQAQRTGYFGARLTIFSYVMAAISVASFAWVPQAAMLLWFIVVSITMIRRPALDSSAGAEPGRPAVNDAAFA
jgi:hypothetical protein